MHPINFAPFSVNFTCEAGINNAVQGEPVQVGAFTPGKWYDVFVVTVEGDNLFAFIKDNMNFMRKTCVTDKHVNVRYKLPYRPQYGNSNHTERRGNFRPGRHMAGAQGHDPQYDRRVAFATPEVSNTGD